jgi:hypothetical protein
MSSPTPPITILGAGLTGLSAAHHLGSDFQLLERLDHVGGHAITLEEGGYRFDRTGHLLHLRDPEIKAWMEQVFPPGHLRTVLRQSLVFSHGRYTRYPYQANTFGLPPAVAYECLQGYLKTHFHQGPRPDPTNFEEFCLRHFGEGFSKHFMIPYNARLWGVHPREITAAWCSRFVPMPRLDDVLAGAVGLNEPHPRISIVIPSTTRESILHAAVVDLREQLKEFGWPYEIILAENGSRDGTVPIARALSEKYPEVQLLLPGRAQLRQGPEAKASSAPAASSSCATRSTSASWTSTAARSTILEHNEADLVIGSKTLAGAERRAPDVRHAATMFFNGLLRVTLGFKGTDTHGLKAFRRTALLDVVRACLVDKDVFASELVIRAERGGCASRRSPCASSRSARRASTSSSACPTCSRTSASSSSPYDGPRHAPALR